MDQKFTLIGHKIAANFHSLLGKNWLQKVPWKQSLWQNTDQVRTYHNVWIYLRAILPHNKLIRKMMKMKR